MYTISSSGAGSPGAVTIYGGVDWGWQNSPTPEPSTYLLAAGLGFIGWRAGALIAPELSPFPHAHVGSNSGAGNPVRGPAFSRSLEFRTFQRHPAGRRHAATASAAARVWFDGCYFECLICL